MQLFLIFSHKLTEEQIKATTDLRVEKIIYLPEDLQKIWSNVDPIGELGTEPLDEIASWLKEHGNEGDFVLIQGEFGATFYLADFCFSSDLVPIYATTKRVSEEIAKSDGTIERRQMFKHVNFRKYRMAFV